MEKLHGIVVPIVTPLTPNAEIDYPAAEKLVEHLIAGGVHGIFALGTTGEAQSLSAQQRADFATFVGQKVAGRVPYIVGVSDTSVADSVALAKTAQAAGACGVVATPPYYFAPAQNDMVNWFTALADASPIPVYLYNMPSHVKVNIAPETAAKLAKHPNIKGLKDSSHNMTYFQALSYITKDDIVWLNILNCFNVLFVLDLIAVKPQKCFWSKLVIINNQHVYMFAQFRNAIRKF